MRREAPVLGVWLERRGWRVGMLRRVKIKLQLAFCAFVCFKCGKLQIADLDLHDRYYFLIHKVSVV